MAAPAAPTSLARGAAAITVATAVSRVTGFVRVMVVAWAMGATYLANTYQTANTAPNVVFELLAAGILTSVFVPTFVSYLVGEKREEGWDAANALGTVALVALIGLALLLALAAPLVMRLLTLGVENARLRSAEIELGTRLLRMFSPQVALYGAGMIMTAALHAHRRFFLAAVAPIFNNVVVIGAYLLYASLRGEGPPTIEGISSGETLVLGIGTTLGVAAMTFSLVPQLFRLGAWALGYAGGYQAGLIVVLLLANRVEGGVAAYQWAFTFFYMPHALFAVPIFSVLFTAMSEHAVRQEREQLAERMRDGLGMLAFILMPIAAVLLVAEARWAVPGLALAHSLAFFGGTLVLGRLLSRRAGSFGGTRLNAALLRAATATGIALIGMLGVRGALGPGGRGAIGVELGAVTAVGFGLYVVVQAAMRSPEIGRLAAVVKRS